MGDATNGDGRRARRERNRLAVIDAMFSLVQEGELPPTVEDVAARAGVSVSSVFRNFDGLPDLQRQALDSFESRFEHLFVVDDAASDRDVRVRSHVSARVELCEQAGGLIRIARARSLDHDTILAGASRLRSRMADQTRQRFASEVSALPRVAGSNLVALIDGITSPEMFELMTSVHSRSPRQVTTSWVMALDALLTENVHRCLAPADVSVAEVPS
ncbi:TetR/AcrR family transcriptional regulator [Ilumatobacter nonamiensis]|uniref:TetR/AcrR family transcriptional regulator n=1 Tax=Ilumatobacter nonamiensis TaxID=467093 RepID=UPI0011D1F446|nr:hypothetical protein [Ilumatobacter nonamiensis]